MVSWPETDEAKTRFDALLETAVEGIIVIDATGHVQVYNPACERLFGYAPDEVIGNNVKMLMPTPYRQEHDQYVANYHATGRKKIIGMMLKIIYST